MCSTVLSTFKARSGSLCLFCISWFTCRGLYSAQKQSREAESGCDGGLCSLDHDCSTAELHYQSRAFAGLKKGTAAMQPYSLCNKFPRDALSYGEEQA